MSAVGDARKRAAETQPVYKPEGYTECDQRSDRSFLVGVNYGRESERERIAQAIEARIVKVPDEDIDSGGFETGIDVGCEIAYRAAVQIAREARRA